MLCAMNKSLIIGNLHTSHLFSSQLFKIINIPTNNVQRTTSVMEIILKHRINHKPDSKNQRIYKGLFSNESVSSFSGANTGHLVIYFRYYLFIYYF